jgi:hypothetical protein
MTPRNSNYIVPYKLNLQPKQKVAWRTKATEILYGGAAGGGKSHAMRAIAIYWCSRIPGLQVYLFRRLSGDLAKNHMEGPTSFPVMLDKAVKKKEVKINYSNSSINFTNGSRIHLCHCQHEKDMYKYQGAEIHLLLIDELTHFTEKIYRFLRGRVRLGGLQVPDKYRYLFPRILNGTNPGNIGHNWVKMTFVDYAPVGMIRRASRKEGGMLRQFIPALLADNQALMQNDPDYGIRLEGLGNEALVKAMLEGDWDIVAGGAFDDVWKRDRHVIEPFKIPPNWYVDRAFDWGSSHPFSVGWWAESNGEEVKLHDGTTRSFPRGTLFRVNEWYGWNGRPNVGKKMLASEIARGIKEREAKMRNMAGFKGVRFRPGPADNSINDVENGQCIANDMKKEGVAWTRSDKAAGSRLNGLELCRGRLKAATRFPMEEPGLFVFKGCLQSIRTIPTLPRDEKNMDDVDSNAEDHIYDEWRYRVLKPKHTATSQEM